MAEGHWPRLERPWREALQAFGPADSPAAQASIEESSDPDGGHREAPTSGGPAGSRSKPQPFEAPEEAFTMLEATGADLKQGAPNINEAFSLEALRRRRLATTLARIVSKVAEDLAGWPVEGDEEWSVPALMKRRMTREPITSCRQSREKESLVLILDTSGSCLPQARFYNAIASSAFQAGDLELYAAPNAGLVARRTRQGWVRLRESAWPFQRRTILFFGDFDGGDAVVEASWSNRLYWFLSEGTRYPSMRQHPWCSYSMRHFKGRWYRCDTEEDFIRLLKKLH